MDRRWESLVSVANDAMESEELEKLPASAVSSLK